MNIKANNKKHLQNTIFYGLVILTFLMIIQQSAFARESVCAQVKIEIRQEASLERQAFDAVMKIHNGLETASLDNIDITVQFTDDQDNPVLASSDPNNTDASFFIKVDSMDGVTDVNGSGEVLPSTTAEIHWLIIPAPGSGGSITTGKAYNVGATLKYKLGSDQEEVTVIPDVIYVKPLPKITLDYFLTKQVVADDPFTTVVEESEPFTLGVRVSNNGQAIANNFKIDSAQPKIIDNDQGLLINFNLVGNTVDDQPVEPDLLLDFGDIPGNSSRIGRWWMITSLAGQFTEFTATWSHADELGGQLTSIMEAVNTHFLVHDVQVDLTGRDEVKDFLALDGDQLRVFESENIDTIVESLDSQTTMTLSHQLNNQDYYDLVIPVTAGFIHTKVAINAALANNKAITQAIRSDNKVLKKANVWISKEGNGSDGWVYYINLFDYNTPGAYTLVFGEKIVTNKAPEINFIPHQSIETEQSLSLTISATDPDNTIPVLMAQNLPTGASFVDQGNGTGVLNWTPTLAQAGQFTITYQASDGAITTERNANISVVLVEDKDKDDDGMDDAWEMEHFGTLEHDGTGDYDNDGKTDLEEFENKTDPAEFYTTGLPEVFSPVVGSEITEQNTSLSINNADHELETSISYQFEIYADEQLTSLVEQSSLISETDSQTTWTLTQTLQDNHWYTWRVRAYNGESYSQWVTGYFFVNTANDVPSIPVILTPPNDTQVSSTTPALEVSPAVDIDGDELKYQFVLYGDSGKTTEIDRIENYSPSDASVVKWFITTPLTNGTQYYWKVQVDDSEGGIIETGLSTFTVNTNNQAPGTPLLLMPAQASTVASLDVELIVNNSIDPEGDLLEYVFELDTQQDFNSTSKQSSTITSGAEQTQWMRSGLMDNTSYYWRVRAFDGASYSGWLNGEFRINLGNDAPEIPVIANPGNQSWVTTLQPVLQIEASTDIDGDEVSYQYQLSNDDSYSEGNYDTFDSSILNLKLDTLLQDNTWYYWRVRAIDSNDLASDWSTTHRFFVNNNGKDDEPTLTFLEPSEAIDIENSLTIQWTDQDPDSNANITLYYNIQADINGATLMVDGLEENAEASSDSYQWNTSDLPEGSYYIIAQISDNTSTINEISPVHVTKINSTPVISISSDTTGTIISGDNVNLTVSIESPVGTYDYRYLIKEQGNTNWVLLQDWTDQATYTLDTAGYSGTTQIQAQAKHSGSTGSVGTDELTLVIDSILDCQAITEATLDASSYELMIPQALYNGTSYHAQFTYLGEQSEGLTWKLLSAAEETTSLPEACESTFSLTDNTVTLSDVHLSGSELHYQAIMTLKTNKSGLFLSLQNFGVKTQLSTDHAGTMTQGDQITFTAWIYDSKEYEYQYLIKAETENNFQVIQNWSSEPSYTLDSTNLLGQYTLKVKVRVTGTSAVKGSDEYALHIQGLWTTEQCDSHTESILDLNNNHLTIPHALYNNKFYHAEFDYQGNIGGAMTWKMATATEETQSLPYGCNARFALEGNTVTLSKIKVKDSIIYYQATLTLENNTAGLFLKLIEYSEL